MSWFYVSNYTHTRSLDYSFNYLFKWTTIMIYHLSIVSFIKSIKEKIKCKECMGLEEQLTENSLK